MQITTDVFGQHNDQNIDRYTITNASGSFIQVITLGATWTGFTVNNHPLIVHFDTLGEYDAPTSYSLCKAIGRVAGRLGKAQATINGKQVHFTANENDNTLHGGPNGFSEIVWNAEQSIRDHDASVTFSRHIPSSEDNFPGDLDARITYTLTDDNQVSINFSAASTEDTLFNPTNHVYWNLTDGQKDLTTQELQVNSTRRLTLADSDKVPTGDFTDLAGTGYDFATARDIPSALADIKAQTGKVEIDDAYEVTPSADKPIATLSDSKSNRHIDIFSDRNSLVVFTANPFDQSKPYNALATEAQTLPDAINHDGFGDIVLPSGQLKDYTIRYKYYEA
ncbi:galactose mutarotase [Secundilactobacillus similis DSM 23365 = JCM 2765]|jgi:aldose 1-epimerase|uniref:Aldose 1-epimerase n=1 Tax=Secundilactobacillus similis DSM 23365 = JCM 2765 TaxID=1423804 RepID=A0A0R2EXM5_9LACO|nr:aldose epimerase family protein [Secundilactobacillus similis]KRN21218.1 aldose 1-epimerase [Secundilactobacillus similis DSM 23365 = JCM 2765]